MRLVACLGVLAILLGGRCSRSVSVDAVVPPPSSADVAAWWRLEVARGAAPLDQPAVARVTAATTAGLESWLEWLGRVWRPHLDRIEIANRLAPSGDPIVGLERWDRWRDLAAARDGWCAQSRSIETDTIAGIVQSLGLDAEAAGRFDRWWRLERGRRLAGGFAPRGGAPASPEAIVAGELHRLDPAVVPELLDALDATATARATAIEAWATARRARAILELASSRPAWSTSAIEDPMAIDAARRLEEAWGATSNTFAVSRARVTSLTVRALLDAAAVAAPGPISSGWRRLAARLAAGDLPSAVRHAEMVAAARRGVQGHVASLAEIAEADRRFGERVRVLEAEVIQAIERGDDATLSAMLAGVTTESRSIMVDRDEALRPFIDAVGSFGAFAIGPDDGWGELTVEARDVSSDEIVQILAFARIVLAPPSRSRDGGPTPFGRLDDPVVAVLVARHDDAYRRAAARSIGAMLDEATATLSGDGADHEQPDEDKREQAVRRARVRLDRLLRELDDLDGDLATALVASMPAGLDVAEVDRWLTRRRRGRLLIPPELALAVSRAGGSQVLVGAWARFERAIERAGLSVSGHAAARQIEDDLADDLGAMRHAVIVATLEDLTMLARDGNESTARDATVAWPNLAGLGDQERSLDRLIRAEVGDRLQTEDAARLLDVWAVERNVGLDGWFAIGREGFDAAARLSSRRDGGSIAALAAEAWMTARAALRDEVADWWSAQAAPAVVGVEGERLELLRGSIEMLAAEARRREIDGLLAMEVAAVLGPQVLDEPFVSRLIASPTPIGLRLAAGPDEPMDEDYLLDLDAEEPVTFRP